MTDARPAATVVVLRPAGSAPPEVLLVRRSRGATFMADAFVFPGGRVDDDDRRAASASDPLGAFRIAATRELVEEANVTVSSEDLVPWARWITPSAEPKRFDAQFFVVAVPAGTEAKVDETEVTEHLWIAAFDALAREQAGDLKLPPPTLRTIEELSAHASVEAVLRAPRSQQPIQPKLVDNQGEVTIVLPWDPEFALLPGDGVGITGDSVLAGGVSRYRLSIAI